MRLIVRESMYGEGDELVAIVEDYQGQLPRVGEYLILPPMTDDGTQDFAMNSWQANCKAVKRISWSILGRPQHGEDHFTGRQNQSVEIFI